jgi:hypothetical protein
MSPAAERILERLDGLRQKWWLFTLLSTAVLVDSPLEITGRIANPEGTPYPGTLYVAPQGEPETSVAMTADKSGRLFKAGLASVTVPLAYRLEIGDSQSPAYQVKVRQRPSIAEVGVTLRYPE